MQLAGRQVWGRSACLSRGKQISSRGPLEEKSTGEHKNRRGILTGGQ